MVLVSSSDDREGARHGGGADRSPRGDSARPTAITDAGYVYEQQPVRIGRSVLWYRWRRVLTTNERVRKITL